MKDVVKDCLAETKELLERQSNIIITSEKIITDQREIIELLKRKIEDVKKEYYIKGFMDGYNEGRLLKDFGISKDDIISLGKEKYEYI